MDDYEDSYYVNRTMCDVLEDMRKCNKVRNYSNLESLIEELQVYGNRMEGGLSDKRDMLEMNKEWSKLRKELKKLRAEVKKVKSEIPVPSEGKTLKDE